MKASDWDEKVHNVISYLNSNPHVIAMNPGLDPIAGYLRDMNWSLFVSEGREHLLQERINVATKALEYVLEQIQCNQ